MIVTVGIRVASHDLAATVDPPGDRQAGPREIDRGKTALVQQKAVRHTRNDVVSHDVAATVDPLRERELGAGEIERGETVRPPQESVSRRPRLTRKSARAHDLMVGVDPLPSGAVGAGHIDRRERSIRAAQIAVGVIVGAAVASDDLSLRIDVARGGEARPGEMDGGEDGVGAQPLRGDVRGCAAARTRRGFLLAGIRAWPDGHGEHEYS